MISCTQQPRQQAPAVAQNSSAQNSGAPVSKTVEVGSSAGGSVQGEVPSGYVKIALENTPSIVDLPMKNGDFP